MKYIAKYLEEDFNKWKDRPYIHTKVDGKYRATTFGTTIFDIMSLAKSFISMGLENKNIIIYGENSYEWMVTDLAVMAYVGVCVPVDKEWTEYDMSHILSVMDIGAVIYSQNKEEIVDNVFKNSDVMCISFDNVVELISMGRNMDTPLTPRDDLEATAQIMFTSGTTDIPKMIPLTQHNLLANWDTLFKRTPMTDTDISYIFLPLNHVYSGVANFLYTIISGMQIYLCSDIRNLAVEMLEVKPTIVCMVPLLLYRVYEQKNQAIIDCLRNIRFLYCGGSFTNPEIKNYFINEGVNLIEAYGTTETSSVIALEIIGDPNRESNGVVLENLDMKIIDADEDGYGEVIVKGESKSKGYLNSEDSYLYFDEEGYYHTGDIGRLDSTRHLYLKGRKRKMIVAANGKNVYVDEIEKMILDNKQILKVKVYEENHRITATIVTELDEKSAQAYIDLVNEKLPGYKKIKVLHIRDNRLGSRIK